jgi:hypothetical protein
LSLLFVSKISRNISYDGDFCHQLKWELSVFSQLFDAKPYFCRRTKATMNTIQVFTIIGIIGAILAGSIANAQDMPLAVEAEDFLLNCYGETNGELNWTVSGGEAPYSYEWSRVSNPFVFAAGSQLEEGPFGPVTGGLEANDYVLKITDAAGVMMTTMASIIAPPPILVTDISVEYLTCATVCDGQIFMEVGGGTGELTVSWADSPSTSPNRSELCMGDYLFFLEDEQGCSQKGVVGIEGPPSLALETNTELPSCSGAANGSILLEIEGGVGEYQYEWAAGGNGASQVNATAGNYPVTISDENNCLLDTVVALPDGPDMLANLQIGYGCGDGQILVATQPINGTAPFDYQWSTGTASPYLLGMSAGMHSLTLTDSEGCEVIKDFTINYVPPLSISASVADVSCFGAQDGAVSLQVNGGQPPFALSWSNGADGMAVDNLAGGEYTYVLSASGCGQARSVIINEPQPLSANFYFDLQTDNLLSAFAQVQGGTPPYQYSWSNGGTNPEIFNLTPGTTYSLTVTDATNCSRTWEVEPALTGTENTLTTTVQVFPNPHSNQFTIQLPQEASNASCRLLNLAGQEVLAWQSLQSPSGLVNTTFLPSGWYVLELQWGNQLQRLRVIKR